MRQFKCVFGEVVDLDNTETYSYYPNNCDQLDDMMFKEIGKAIAYMDYFHPNWFPNNSPQRLQVNILIKDFCDNRRDNYQNSMWYKEKIFLFQNETENMC